MGFDVATEVSGLAQRLVQISSAHSAEGESAVAALLTEQAREWGLQATTTEVSEGRTNAVIRLPGSGAAPAVALCGHTDTVPCGDHGWSVDPLAGAIRDGQLWGRGAVDMKGGLAAMLTSLAVLRDRGTELPGDVVLAAVVGEEVDCAGSRHLDGTDVLDHAAWLIVGEPTGLDLVVAHKGAVRVEITVRGRAAHGAKPELGANAIVAMSRLVRTLAEFRFTVSPHPLLGHPTASLNTVEGGTAINVVPDHCRAVLDVRTVPGVMEEDILSTIKAAADETETACPGVRIESTIMHVRHPVSTPVEHPLVRVAQRAAADVLSAPRTVRGASYFSDASVLAPPRNLPTLLFGPGEEALMHQPDERVGLADLTAAAEFYAALPGLLFATQG
jgi:succinyl-diaminopimelate desuccinylase